jgi:hypothetical protein
MLRAGEAQHAPCRMAFLYVPNGIHMPLWTPAAEGRDFALPATLAPLAPFRGKLLVLSGLTQDKARPNGDGPGDHARAAAAFLTGAQPVKTHGADIRVGVSVDQVAASRIGERTRFPSLEIGCDWSLKAGDCDSGYSCAYSANISWKSATTPLAKENDPRLVFERLFGDSGSAESAEGRARRLRRERSLLDFVAEDAVRLGHSLGATDRRKLDEYLTALRDVERRIERTEAAPRQDGSIAKPKGIPKDYGEHLRLLADILALAFRADLTRVATFMLANEGSNRSYPSLGVRDGHHDISHHGSDAEKQAKIAKINAFHLQTLVHFLEKLEEAEEGDGRVLDHSAILYGSGIGDGNRHNHDDLPILLAGGARGSLATGRHLRYPRNTPLNNLYLSLLDRVDASSDSLGDSTGRLPRLAGDDRAF